jgi:hypothetical protein
MKVLLVGVGGVGEAIAVIAKDRSWVEKLVLSDYNLDRAKEVQAKVGLSDRMPVERIDAGDRGMIAELARKHGVDLIMNAVDPVFNEAIFDAAYEVGCNYMDMAMTLSTPHPSDPFNACGVKLGDYQFERAGAWEKKGLLALVGMGVEPGMADVFAKYAETHLFDEIEEIQPRGAGIRFRAQLLHLDHDRGVPQSARDLGGRQGLVDDGAVLRARDLRVPGGHRSSGVRERGARRGASSASLGEVQEGHLQVRLG